MPATKRVLEEDSIDQDEQVHPSRRRRTEGDEGRVELAKIFNDLRDEIPSVRLGATKELLKNLSSQTPDQSSRIDYATTRLIKGVCSGAKASRPGFSIALAETLRLMFDKKSEPSTSITALLEKIIALTNPESKAKGEEARNYLLGRQFAYQAVLRSQILHHISDDDIKLVFDAIADLAAHKQWLRTECAAGLCNYLESDDLAGTISEEAKILLDSWLQKGLLKSPEGVALFLLCKKRFPTVKLPKNCWHNNDPFSPQERPVLTKILLQNSIDEDDGSKNGVKASGARQSSPNFAWTVVLAHFFETEDVKSFSQFWSECVAKPMFSSSSSTERKALGLQIFTKAVAAAHASLLSSVVHPNIMQCIIDQRVKSERYLFEATKQPLNQIVVRAKRDSAAATEMLDQMLTVVPAQPDKLTKSTLEALLAAADPQGLTRIVERICEICRQPGTSDANEAEKRRRAQADLLLALVRTRRSEPAHYLKDAEGKSKASNVAEWLQTLFGNLAELAYGSETQGTSPRLSDSTREVFRERMMSALGHIVTLPLKQAVWPPRVVTEKLYEMRESLVVTISKDSMKLLKQARKVQKEAIDKAKDSNEASPVVMQAFHLLLSLGMLQVYKQEPDSDGVLEDIIACYQNAGESDDSSTMLVELLLSFVSKPSALFRKLAEQVFTAFSPDVTSEALDSMIDILSQKESMAGQQELFDQHDDHDHAGEGSDDADDSDEDMEDVSDVELVNGEINGAGKKSDSDQSDDDEDDEEATADDIDEEQAAFDRKLADALGTTGMDSDADSDGSSMDDDAMMALDGHLTTIFRERAKTSNRKLENKSAKENIQNFKNRVLDLLEIYVKTQYANSIAVNLILPLAQLTRTTTSAATAKKAFGVLGTYFDACKKHRNYPSSPISSKSSNDDDDSDDDDDNDDDDDDDDDDVLFTLVSYLIAEARLGGSKIHAAACSRSLQFLAKLLVTQNPENWTKIAIAYVTLQTEWRTDPKTKIHSSVLKDWHSWSMQR
jgi:DNA polymerase phi